MKIKTSELSGIRLDYAVALAEGAANLRHDTVASWWLTLNGQDITLNSGWAQSYQPSTDWNQGGPIIEREGIDVYCTFKGNPNHRDVAWRRSTWRAKYHHESRPASIASTPLIAAMRCYVTSKLGDEIEIPEKLI